jgi:hypothetical protein
MHALPQDWLHDGTTHFLVDASALQIIPLPAYKQFCPTKRLRVWVLI